MFGSLSGTSKAVHVNLSSQTQQDRKSLERPPLLQRVAAAEAFLARHIPISTNEQGSPSVVGLFEAEVRRVQHILALLDVLQRKVRRAKMRTRCLWGDACAGVLVTVSAWCCMMGLPAHRQTNR